MTAAEPTILATCGGLDPGSWTDAVYGPLILHAIQLARVEGRAPRVAHVNTAGGDQRSVEGAELEAARAAGVEASHIRFFPHPNTENLREHVLNQDVIWVSGGSVVNLLAVWRAHGLDRILREAWEAGVVLAGGSAGALCWHEGGTTASFGPQIEAVSDGLGFVPGSLGVHYDSDANRRVAHEAAIGSGVIPPGYALDEGVGLVYSGTRLVDVVTDRGGQHAWRVEEVDGRAVETILEPRLLPGVESAAGCSATSCRTTSPTPPTTSRSHPQPTFEEA
jgi:peptidase E